MSHQLTFADSEFSTKRRQTRKEIFLSRMEQILPWQNMVEVIEPFYPKAGNGRRPYPLETMLRIHCMQHWYNLSDGAMEDALYEIASMRLFARLSLDSALPDRTTIMNFRHLLEQHQLARQLFKTINRWLAEAGVMMTQGTLVDATIIEAPSSTKNKEQQRDPEMHQTKKGNQWHFGMKAHIGVDAKSGLTHSLVTTAANEHDLNQLGNLPLVDATIIEAPSSTKNKEQQRDPEMHQTKKGNQWHFGMKAHIGVDAKSGLTHSLVTTAANEHDLNQLGNLLHGEEQFVSADAGYQGAPQREELAEVDVDWLIAERPGKVKTLKQHPRKNKTAINIEYMKASIRARVEHPFRIIKRQFGFVKARYKGLLKNDNQLAMLFTLANLFRVDQMIRQWERSQ
ncbi:IS5 family transposase [Klebsiella pneumoniae]|nr:IS5 family transposase [Klebsiella pneumoniae]